MTLSDLKMAVPDPYMTYKVLHDLPLPTFLASSPSPLPPFILNSIQSPKVPAHSLPLSAKYTIASACNALPYLNHLPDLYPFCKLNSIITFSHK